MLAKCVAEIGHCTAALRALQKAQLPQVSKSSLLLKELITVVCSICSLRFLTLLTMGLEQCLCFRVLCAFCSLSSPSAWVSGLCSLDGMVRSREIWWTSCGCGMWLWHCRRADGTANVRIHIQEGLG